MAASIKAGSRVRWVRGSSDQIKEYGRSPLIVLQVLSDKYLLVQTKRGPIPFNREWFIRHVHRMRPARVLQVRRKKST